MDHRGRWAGLSIERDYMDGVPIAEMRQLDVLLTPHGFVKAALAPGANPTLVTSMPRGRRVTDVSITALGKYRVAATINDRNEIEFVQTTSPTRCSATCCTKCATAPEKQFGA